MADFNVNALGAFKNVDFGNADAIANLKNEETGFYEFKPIQAARRGRQGGRPPAHRGGRRHDRQGLSLQLREFLTESQGTPSWS